VALILVSVFLDENMINPFPDVSLKILGLVNSSLLHTLIVVNQQALSLLGLVIFGTAIRKV
jgi:hypothetical protein